MKSMRFCKDFYNGILCLQRTTRIYLTPTSASSLYPSQRHDLFMHRFRTIMAHTRSFAWSITLELPPSSFSLNCSLCSPFLVFSIALSLTFLLELKCTESTFVWLTP